MHVINFNFQFSIKCSEKFSKKIDSTPLSEKILDMYMFTCCDLR